MSEVASAFVALVPSFRGGAKAIGKELDGPAAAAGRSSGKQAGFGFKSSFLGSVKGIAAPLASIFALSAGVGFFKGAVDSASDLNEAGTKLQQVFGPATKSLYAFADKGAKTFGQTKLDVLNAAASFGVYGRAAGLVGAANAKFSKDLVGLSTDLASFYNTDPSQAVEAISAGLRGESEPLRAFGVLLDDATLRTRALKLGLIKTTKDALTPQTKALAAQAEIMHQTKIAQGDFARTSGGLANQQRILTAQFGDFKSKVGTALLPVMVGLTTFLNKALFPALASGYGVVSNLAGALGDRLVPAFGRARGIAAGLFKLLFKGDYTGALGKALGVSEDSKVIGFLLNARNGVKGLFDLVFRGDYTGGLGRALGLAEDSRLVAFVLNTRNGVKGLFDLVFKGDYTRGLGRALGISEDSKVVGFVLNARAAVRGLFDLLFKGDYTGALGKALGVSEDSKVIGYLFGVRDAFFTVRDAVQNFATGAKSNGINQFFGDLFDVVKNLGEVMRSWYSAELAVATFLKDNVLPVVVAIATAIVTKVVPALADFVSRVSEHEGVVKTIAAVIAAVLIPHYVALGVAAVVSSVRQAGAWAVSSTAAARAVVAHSIAVVRVVAGWVLMSGAAARSAAAWVAASARSVASLALTAAAFASYGAAMAASMAATTARVVAGWVRMAVQSLIQAARMAVAWVIAMGPVGWVIALVVGLVVLIIANWSRVKTVTLAVWRSISGAVSTAWREAAGFVTKGVATIVEKVTSLPGKIAALNGQMLTAGKGLMGALFDGLRSAAGAVGGFASDIGRSIANNLIRFLNGVLPHSIGIHKGPLNIDVPLFPHIPELADGGIIPATPGGRLVRVAEAGRAEAVIPLDKLAHYGGSGSDGGGDGPLIGRDLVINEVTDTVGTARAVTRRLTKRGKV